MHLVSARHGARDRALRFSLHFFLFSLLPNLSLYHHDPRQCPPRVLWCFPTILALTIPLIRHTRLDLLYFMTTDHSLTWMRTSWQRSTQTTLIDVLSHQTTAFPCALRTLQQCTRCLLWYVFWFYSGYRLYHQKVSGPAAPRPRFCAVIRHYHGSTDP